MKRLVLRILGGLLLVAVLAVSLIFVQSNRIVSRRHAFREHPVSVPSDSASLAHGERLARARCMGCHLEGLTGQVFFDEPTVARIVAPNVPARLATLTDAEFAGFMRSGVRGRPSRRGRT